MSTHHFAAATLALAGLSCVPEESEENVYDESFEEVGSASDALTAGGPHIATSNGGSVSVYMAPDGYSSFLMGALGNIRDGGGAWTTANWPVPPADNLVSAYAAPGATVRAYGGWSSSPTIAETVIIHVGAGSDPGFSLGAVAGGRRCFLKHIANNGPTSTFANIADRVYIHQIAGNWHLGGTGNVRASAGCLTVTTHLSSIEVALPGYYDLGPSAPGKWCWLTGIGGNFRNDNLNDGAFVYYDFLLAKWRLYVAPYKYAKAECNI